jgi:hypothetical protein
MINQIVLIISYMSFCSNFLFYVKWSRNFRKGLREIFCCSFSRRQYCDRKQDYRNILISSRKSPTANSTLVMCISDLSFRLNGCACPYFCNAVCRMYLTIIAPIKIANTVVGKISVIIASRYVYIFITYFLRLPFLIFPFGQRQLRNMQDRHYVRRLINITML